MPRLVSIGYSWDLSDINTDAEYMENRTQVAKGLSKIFVHF